MKVGIIGGAGYTAGELIRILLNHPKVEIGFVNSQSNAGKKLSDVHEGLIGETGLRFSETFDLDSVDTLFLCQGHGQSSAFWEEHRRPEKLKVIDLAQDFRDESDGYVYGLTELNSERIAAATKVANPGCFATAIQLALLPLASAGMLNSEVHVTAVTGSTGAGVKPGPTTHFSWRTDNLSIYKLFSHQHLAEIRRTLTGLQPGFDSDINFVPVRGDFARGIFASVYTDCDASQQEIETLYSDFYAEAPFTHVADAPVDMKQVVNTNKAILFPQKIGRKLHVTSTIDNLLKGASGQAVENMNLMWGFDRKEGLRLKPSAF